MNKKHFLLLLLPISILLISWGTFGHEHINRAAVLALPQPIQTFFYNHIDYITQESTVPDLRKYTLNDKTENPRHFIDLENFGSADSLPKSMEEAKKKYDEKFLQQNGTLPWHWQDMMQKLTRAFKEKRKTEILFLAADLGHYIGDAHMPLHTSANHDGQLTNQKGIHAFWESRIPELYGNNYNYFVHEAKFIDNIDKEIWNIVFDSHRLKDSVLIVDKELRKKFGEENIFEKDSKGNIRKGKFGQTYFTNEYAKAYHTALNGMIEKQLKKAIVATSSFWYSAWINAGKPNLSSLDSEELTQQNSKQLKKELKLFKKGKLFGIESEKEF